MKLHLPLFLRKAILTLMLAYGVPAVHAANLTLGAADSLSVDYSASGSLLDLNNGTLRLSCGTTLQLSSCGEGDGKTYILLTGVSELLDAQGNVISLDSTNNAASRYFDAAQPGSGFWADGTLQLNHGALQLVLHNETVKDAITITTRQENPSAYQYYAGVSFENIEYAVGSYAYGGAIYGDTITLSDNGSVSFIGNTASSSDYSARGGAIYGGSYSPITLSNNGSVVFEGNTASSRRDDANGGAIDGDDITLSGNGSVVFEGNTACTTDYSAKGGAIYGYSYSTITLSNNGGVVFEGNTASGSSSAYGGAIYGYSNSTITLSNNGSVVFEGNTASTTGSYSEAKGGAIYGYSYSTITLSNNGGVVFEGNTASGSSFAKGGAIYGYSNSTITLSNNGSVEFIGNTASSVGGAIYGYSNSTITLSNNGSVEFIGNTASSVGGAIYGDDITLSNNESVVFEGNTASSRWDDAYGGAIYGYSNSTITLSNNGSVVFDGNTASGSSYANGGAIYAYGNLSIQNNDSVLFEKNAEIRYGTYRLRSIYANSYGYVVSLSAAADKSIEFRDSIYIDSGRTVNLNADYGDTKQQGDIIFTGKYTEQHLNELLEAAGAGRSATAEEILNSRTTEVYTMTNLYGGRLRVEDGAIYKGYGITVHEDSAATVRVKEAELNHPDDNLTFNAGTTLELVGNNVISGNAQMLEGSTLLLKAQDTLGVTDFIGNMNLAGGVILALSNDSTWTCENGILMYVSGSLSGWDTGNVTVTGAGSYGASDLSWVDNLLVLNYNAETFNKYFNGLVTYFTRVDEQLLQKRHYESISFDNISSSSLGGAIYGYSSSSITLSNNGSVVFEGNTASGSDDASGGAIYGSTIELCNNGSVTFSGNTASGSDDASGGAIYGYSSSSITLSNNGSVVFEGNTASSTDYRANGGAIYGGSYSPITLSNNVSVLFEGNTTSSSSAYASGGAIYGGGTITLRTNGSVVFEGNTASTIGSSSSANGGAIYGASSNRIELSDNVSVLFEGNTASTTGSYSEASGGAIYGSGTITLRTNGSVVFEGNTASTTGSYSEANGGAIYGDDITLSNNVSVLFEGNTACTTDYSAKGGAIYGYSYSTITLSNNGGVVFEGNTASGSDDAFGGAIYGYFNSTFTLSNNGSVVFEGNTASSTDYRANGGAIYGSTIELSTNGSVVFDGNTASGSSCANGGAIYGYDITLSTNGSVVFDGNTASGSSYANGGAIHAYGNLSIQNNDSVLFEKNAEIRYGTYRLRSIYADGSGHVISLSAAVGKSIEFRDSVYIASGSTVNLNADYGDTKQQGDIIFTGKYTEQHLNELLEAAGAGRAATAQEILDSRTTEVYALTNLYGGRLRVEDGAIYKGYGITVHEDSAATVRVKEAELNHPDGNLIFNAGTTLELVGNNVISGNAQMLEGSTLLLKAQDTLGVTDFIGNMNLAGGVILALSNDSTWTCENGILMYVSGSLSGWDTGNVTVTGAGSYGASDLSWVDNLLVLNYNAETFNKYFNGLVTYFTRVDEQLLQKRHYESISFENISSSSLGGAIYGYFSSSITLSNNGSVVFEGNTASGSDEASGGAIYGYSNSTFTLSNNGSVVFEGNTASGSSSAYGGAIYGVGSSITLSNNGSVIFEGNTASMTGSYFSANGGAIYGGTIELSNNVSVIFEGNTASTTGSYSEANGGAIYGVGSSITLSNNGSVEFIGNTASSVGGAIYGYSNSTITLSNNGSVVFEGNTASSSSSSANGGAIYGGTIELSNNGSVVFEGNTASSSSSSVNGGAIYAYGNLSIQNNDSVLFEKNAEIRYGFYRQRSIYAGGSGGVISLSAAVGKSIEFRDSVYIASGSTVNLNADYGDTKQQGDIIFTGKYTEQHLNELLEAAGAGRAATAQEILDSRTTEVNTMTNLYGGRLRVEDGAIYKGYGITVHEDSAAAVRVKEAELNHTGYDLTFSSGSTLELAGANVISGTVEMKNGSVLRFDGSLVKGTTHISGNLTLDGASIISLDSPDSWAGENHVLLYVGGDFIVENGFFSESNAVGYAGFSQVDNLLVWNYNAETFSPFKVSLELTSRQTHDVAYHHYDKLGACGFSSSSKGGAIYGSVTIWSCNDVEFSNNISYSPEAYPYCHGGAVYGDVDIKGCNDVEFSGNIAYASVGPTYGGAIYGNATMIENNKISFIGNKTNSNSLARSSYWSSGGAIYGDVLMSGNGEISFIGNSTSEYGGAINGTVSMNNNERVCFIGNAAKSLSSGVSGGAVYCSLGSISLCDNDYVLFDSNTSEWYGGALSVSYSASMTLSGNASVEFIGNSAYESGGAIYGVSNSSMVLSNNGTVVFRDNTAYDDGAIYTLGSLYIQNNEHVLFEDNARERGSFRSLRSIYAEGGEDVVISFSAADGKCIEFRDPIYINQDCTFNLNADYVDENGNSIRQQGDIIFSSAVMEGDDINAQASTVSAVQNVSSRTSTVNALVNLYGGTLRVESGAVFKGRGITVHEASDATVQVKSATLNHTGYTLTFASGTSLKLADDYKLYARSLVMNEGSSLHLDASYGRGQLVLSGDLALNGNVGITLSPDMQSTDENLLFMYVDGSVSGWNPQHVTVDGADGADASDFTWIDHCLVLNYNSATYKPHLFIFEPQVGSMAYSDYAGVFFGGRLSSTQPSAISGASGDVIQLSNNEKVEFQCNVAEHEGGAIYGDGSTIVLDDNACVVFSCCESEGDGGAIYGENASSISLSRNTSLTLQGNVSDGYGGAIYERDGSITIEHNATVSISENVARYSGGGLYGYGGSISLNNNGRILFSGNSAGEGTGICGYDCQISVNNNEQIEFVGNICSSYYGGGVVICARSGSSVEMNGNGSVVFNGNYGASYGGAVFVDGDSSFMLKNNASVTFCGNLAEGGGAVYGGSVTITDNGNVLFSGNTAYDYDGGAIGATNALSIRNNDSVLFEKNLDVKYGPNDASSDAFYLRSIYIQTDTAEESREMLISAAQGKSVEFRDSVYISENISFSLNEDYVDASGKTIRQQGDIIFTGAYTEKHLAEMKGSSGTEDEIQNSRTSEVYTMTHLYGGRLRIEAGAIYKGSGMAVAENSGAAVWLRNAQMLHQGHNISFGKGTTFGLRGCNVSLSDNLSLAGGSSLSFDIAAENISTAVLTHTGTLTLGGIVTLNIGTADSNLAHGRYKLLQVTDLSSLENWSNENLKMGDGSYTISDIEWVDNTLCFNYSGQKLSDLPILPEIPESEIPDTPVTPDEPEIPDTPVTPDEPEIPDTPVTPDEPEIPDTPVTPDEPEIPDTPVTPDEPEIPDTPVTPDEPEIPDTPVTPDEPEIPDTPVTPDEPEIPDTPVTPDEPEIPDTPVTPDEPEKSEPLNPLRPGAKPVLVGGDIDKNTEVILTEKGNVTLEGKVNAGAITVNSDKNITFKSNKKKPGSLTGDGDLTKKGKGTLTLNDGNSSWTGDTYLQAGTIKVKGTTSLGKGDVYVQGGTLNLGSKAIANDIVQEKSAAIKSGKKFTGTYTLESGELQKGSTLNIAKTATLAGGTVNGALSGTGKTEVTGNVKLGDKGKITTKALTLGEDATLSTSAKGLSSKTTTLSIGEDATLVMGGKMTVDSLKMNGGTLKTTASKPAAMTVKNNMELTDAVLSTNGKVTTNKLTLNNSTMGIKGAKAQNLTVKQALTIGSGSALTLNGKLSAGSLTIKSGGMLTMSGSKPVTLKVKGALTLNEGSSIIMNYSFVQGKTYKVLTFGSYSGSKDYYSIFGVEADDCTITNTGKALTLTVTGKWKPQSQQKAVSADAATPIVAAKLQANPVADALVQANWGQLEASRAFVNAMANRSMAVQLGNGERAVWASAIGSSSRHDTASGHNGADTNVSGGAFGLETQVGRASLFGMALGNSWTRVSAHGFGTIEQDTTHLGLYGQTNWRSGVTADWSAAYGRSESESMGSDWNQKHLQLDGRVSYNHELNARTVLSPFAGLQYYASDAAGIGTTDTGSLQNLRAEIGVAASHRTGKLGVYGEIAVHQDLARNNPSVSMEGARYTGMNPGRTGLNFTVGASYELNDQWSLNASYTGEFVENANAHSANVGVSYKF